MQVKVTLRTYSLQCLGQLAGGEDNNQTGDQSCWYQPAAYSSHCSPIIFIILVIAVVIVIFLIIVVIVVIIVIQGVFSCPEQLNR